MSKDILSIDQKVNNVAKEVSIYLISYMKNLLIQQKFEYNQMNNGNNSNMESNNNEE